MGAWGPESGESASTLQSPILVLRREREDYFSWPASLPESVNFRIREGHFIKN